MEETPKAENLFSLYNIAQLNMGLQHHLKILSSVTLDIEVTLDVTKRLGAMCAYLLFILISEQPELGLEEADALEYGICETLGELRKYISYLIDDIKTHPVLDQERSEAYIKVLVSEEAVVAETISKILEYLPERHGKTNY